jgi:hypothetical protein
MKVKEDRSEVERAVLRQKGVGLNFKSASEQKVILCDKPSMKSEFGDESRRFASLRFASYLRLDKGSTNLNLMDAVVSIRFAVEWC